MFVSLLGGTTFPDHRRRIPCSDRSDLAAWEWLKTSGKRGANGSLKYVGLAEFAAFSRRTGNCWVDTSSQMTVRTAIYLNRIERRADTCLLAE
jgi:hypothetical protein